MWQKLPLWQLICLTPDFKQNGEVIRAAHVPLNSSATKAVFSLAEINLIFIKAKRNYVLGG